MPLELKGLKDKALAARRHIDRLNRAYDGFNEAAPAHARDVEGIAGDIESMTDDLAAAARIMGNSVNGSDTGASGKAEEKSKEQPATEQPKTTANAQAPAPSSSAPVVKLVDTPDSKSVDPVGSNPTGGTITMSATPAGRFDEALHQNPPTRVADLMGSQP